MRITLQSLKKLINHIFLRQELQLFTCYNIGSNGIPIKVVQNIFSVNFGHSVLSYDCRVCKSKSLATEDLRVRLGAFVYIFEKKGTKAPDIFILEIRHATKKE